MNFEKLMAALEAAAPAVEKIVSITHPESAEAVKIAAGFELFQIVANGVHAIITAGETSTAPGAPAAQEVAAPNAG